LPDEPTPVFSPDYQILIAREQAQAAKEIKALKDEKAAHYEQVAREFEAKARAETAGLPSARFHSHADVIGGQDDGRHTLADVFAAHAEQEREHLAKAWEWLETRRRVPVLGEVKLSPKVRRWREGQAKARRLLGRKP
jgi:hypothetical protein